MLRLEFYESQNLLFRDNELKKLGCAFTISLFVELIVRRDFQFCPLDTEDFRCNRADLLFHSVLPVNLKREQLTNQK